MAVLEGDYANLYGLGLPLSLSLQLQIQKLQLSGALWTAKASASGFSISLYWPSTGTAPEKEKAKKTRRKRRKHKNKNKNKVISTSDYTYLAEPTKSILQADEVSVPINEHSSPEVVANEGPSVDLATCSEIQYEVKEGIHGVAYSHDGERGWTPVVGKKKKRCVPDFIKRRFPPDHPVRTSNSSESDGDSTSEEDLNTVIPNGANVNVQFKMVDNTPGLTVRTRSTRSWTPIATRTRARLKK